MIIPLRFRSHSVRPLIFVVPDDNRTGDTRRGDKRSFCHTCTRDRKPQIVAVGRITSSEIHHSHFGTARVSGL